jgi:hypothetical protein
VSRWWAEQLRIGLSPERVELARAAVWPRRTWRQHSVPSAAPTWQVALQTLDAALPAWGARGRATVVLSNHWVRYQVLPWRPELTRTSELQQLARLRFEHSFGAAVADWQIHVGDGGWGRATVACAVDAALIDQLRLCLARHGLRLASLQPLLMAAYNRVRHRLAPDAALAVVEPGRVCLALTHQAHWRDIASRRFGADPAQAVEQEMATMDATATPPCIDVLLVGQAAAWPAAADRPARLLTPRQGAGATSLAMCGTG